MNQMIRKVNARFYGPYIGGHMLACKIMRLGYFWFTKETDCY